MSAPSSELANGRQYQSKRARVLEGIIAVADCDADDDEAWNRAWARFWDAVRAAGWEPAKGEDCEGPE